MARIIKGIKKGLESVVNSTKNLALRGVAATAIFLGGYAMPSFSSSIPTDLNRDGTVDQADVSIVEQDLGKTDPNIVPVYANTNNWLEESDKTYVLMEDGFGCSSRAGNIIIDLNNKQIIGPRNGVGLFPGCFNVTIKNGRMNNVNRGVLCYSGFDKLCLENLTIDGCKEYGLNIRDVNELYVRNVTIRNAKLEGIRLWKVTNATFENIEVSDCNENGISGIECSNLYFKNILVNHCGYNTKNKKDGVDMERCSNVHFDNLWVYEAADDDIDFTGSTGSISNSGCGVNGGIMLESFVGGAGTFHSNVILRNFSTLSYGPYGANVRGPPSIATFYSILDLRVLDPNSNPLVGAKVYVYNYTNLDPNTTSPSNAPLDFLLESNYLGKTPQVDVLYRKENNRSNFSSFGPYLIVAEKDGKKATRLWDGKTPLEETLQLK